MVDSSSLLKIIHILMFMLTTMMKLIFIVTCHQMIKLKMHKIHMCFSAVYSAILWSWLHWCIAPNRDGSIEWDVNEKFDEYWVWFWEVPVRLKFCSFFRSHEDIKHYDELLCTHIFQLWPVINCMPPYIIPKTQN